VAFYYIEFVVVMLGGCGPVVAPVINGVFSDGAVVVVVGAAENIVEETADNDGVRDLLGK
jgi:hypothetical protein